MTVNGLPIDDYVFRPAAASIHFTLAYEQEQARIYAGLSSEEYNDLPGVPMWINPERPTLSKSHVLVLYRMSNRISAAAQDAQARKMERDARRPGRH